MQGVGTRAVDFFLETLPEASATAPIIPESCWALRSLNGPAPTAFTGTGEEIADVQLAHRCPASDLKGGKARMNAVVRLVRDNQNDLYLPDADAPDFRVTYMRTLQQSPVISDRDERRNVIFTLGIALTHYRLGGP